MKNDIYTPMEINVACHSGSLVEVEKQRRPKNLLCLYCGPHHTESSRSQVNQVRTSGKLGLGSTFTLTNPNNPSNLAQSNKFEVLHQLDEVLKSKSI